MCTIRMTIGLENSGSKEDGPHVVVAVTDVQWLVTIMNIHQSVVVDSVGSVTRKAGLEKITLLTIKSAIETSNTLPMLSTKNGVNGL